MPSADETRTLLVDALRRLARTRTLSEISVRDVAREAGVNHGLVHRHFGSKENLIRAATESITAEVRAIDPGGRPSSAQTFRYIREHPELVRVLAQACLEGRQEILDAAAPQPDHLCAVVERLQAALDSMGLPVTPDPHVLNAYAIASILGWVLFRPMLTAGYGVSDDADGQLEGLLELLDFAIDAERAAS